MAYEIRRFYLKHDYEVVAEYDTLDEAQEHCNDPETSSTTAVSEMAQKRTELFGPWFDGYTEV